MTVAQAFLGRFRHVAPAGAPIRFTDLGGWAHHLMSRGDHANALGEELRRRLGVRHCSFTSTGRAGMTLLLRALARLKPGRSEVIIPSYTCYSVAASIVRAGLTPRIVDVVPETLDYDHDRLECSDLRRVLAIVATNLYGLPNAMPRLSAFAAQAGVYLVDDSAQALGARIDRWSGTWGDVGLYSFDKGKNVSAIDGGAIVTSSDSVAGELSRLVADLPAPSARRAALNVCKACAYAALLRPTLYWIPKSIPQLALGTTRFSVEFEIQALSGELAGLALTMLARLEEFTCRRQEAAAWLHAGLERIDGITLIRTARDSEPAYLRFPMLASDRQHQRALIAALNDNGIGATGSYPASLADVPELNGVLLGRETEANGGRAVADRIVTLPTHPYVSRRDLSRTVDVVRLVSRSSALRRRGLQID